MEGNTLLPGSLDEFVGRNISVSICHVGGVWLAWIPEGGNPCTCAGEMVRGLDAPDLLAKLIAKLG